MLTRNFHVLIWRGSSHGVVRRWGFWRRKRTTRRGPREYHVCRLFTSGFIVLHSFHTHSDHQEKEKALKKLRQKALDKNPNEFTFHMINSQLKEGRHYEKRSDASREQIRLIEDRDMKYISYKRKLELEKIAKLEASLHRISLPMSGP